MKRILFLDLALLFVIAVYSQNYEFPKNADGEYDTDFVDVVLWNGIAENTAEYCHKGDIIGVKGRIQTSTYETEDGEKRKSTQIVAEKITFLSSSKEKNDEVEKDDDMDM